MVTIINYNSYENSSISKQIKEATDSTRCNIEEGQVRLGKDRVYFIKIKELHGYEIRISNSKYCIRRVIEIVASKGVMIRPQVEINAEENETNDLYYMEPNYILQRIISNLTNNDNRDYIYRILSDIKHNGRIIGFVISEEQSTPTSTWSNIDTNKTYHQSVRNILNDFYK